MSASNGEMLLRTWAICDRARNLSLELAAAWRALRLRIIPSTSMSFAGFDDAWGAPPEPPTVDIVKDAMKKEKVLK